MDSLCLVLQFRAANGGKSAFIEEAHEWRISGHHLATW
jgi:hypothetical protein